MRSKIVLRFLPAAPFLLLAACSSHSFPVTDSFVLSTPRTRLPADTAQVFVDANGSFYPSGWQRYLHAQGRWKADSLLNESADNPAFRALIEQDEGRQLSELQAFGSGAGRVFVLVHGYNNSMGEARRAYEAIEARLGKRPGDRVVRFYWDGLIGKGVGAADVWFKAVGYSQVAGVRGLRKVLSQFPDQQVVVITHSRGASVLLSALGDPIYDPVFMQKTLKAAAGWGPAYEALLKQPPLASQGGAIDVLMLAPAVDRIDFCDASQQPVEKGAFECGKLRSFAPRVKTLRYTLNPKDRVLNKFIGLASSLTPTGLGVKPEVGAALKAEMPILREYPLSPAQHRHRFSSYVATRAFRDMLADMNGAKGR